MKRVTWLVVIAGFLTASAIVQARERHPDRVKGNDATKADIILASGPRLLADSNYEAPPPAPGIVVPPGPLPALAGPIPDAGPSAVGGPPIAMAPAASLYPCVRYKDRRNIAPYAVPMCIAVRDPCAGKDPCSRCAPPKCVLVEICVPPCGCPKITCKHDGARVRYDYGKYAVNITSRHGVVVVNYDD
jgi:hypothetical protein